MNLDQLRDGMKLAQILEGLKNQRSRIKAAIEKGDAVNFPPRIVDHNPATSFDVQVTGADHIEAVRKLALEIVSAQIAETMVKLRELGVEV